MNTATATPVTEQADRFRCESEVPDPPRDAAGRKQYWEDTVAEAVAELRRRLASTRDEKSFQALQMIVDLEKTRLRHKTPVAGTEVSAYSSPLPPMEECVPGGREPKKSEPEASATDEPLTPPAPPIRVGSVSDDSSPPPSLTLPARTEPETAPPLVPVPPKPLRPIPLHNGHFHDHHDDWMIDPDRLAMRDDSE